MIRDEYEIKLMLSKEQYEKLSGMFPDSKRRTFTQTNYYYDTLCLDMRKNNTTVRVREKNGRFKVTIKEHLSGRSTEKSFEIECLPSTISNENMELKLFGNLCTKRTEIEICEGITLMLDYNKYLDTEDYEMELEYVPEFKEKADEIILELQSILGYRKVPTLSKSKSERFFRNFFKVDRTCLI